MQQFKRIIRQPNSSYADQVKRIDALVEKMDPERQVISYPFSKYQDHQLQLMYREFMRENDDRERLHRDRVHKTVAEMSEKAQEQFAKVPTFEDCFNSTNLRYRQLCATQIYLTKNAGIECFNSMAKWNQICAMNSNRNSKDFQQ